MKKRSNIFVNEECANSASGCGVRGLGNVTGTPKVGEDGEVNPHIERVGIESSVNNETVRNWIKNNTEGIYAFDSEDWWEDLKGRKSRMKAATKSFIRQVKGINEGLEKNHYEAIDDVHINLDNRNHAIEDYGYGPMNPKEPSGDFWKQKAKLWDNSVEEAKKSRCGNCAAFNRSEKILKRIADNLGPLGEKIVEKSKLGFCEMFHFKCAAERTCDAWLVNGPITEEIANVTGPAVPGTGDTGEAFPRPDNKYKKQNEKDSSAMMRRLPTGMFAGNMTFMVPSVVFNKARNQKMDYKHWRTYLDNSDIHPEIRDFAKKNPKDPIIFEDEKTGYMFYARYGKKGKKK
jgi:hypothetical protein